MSREQWKPFLIGVVLMALLAAGVIFYLLRKHKAETDGFSSMIEADKGQIAFHENKAREAIAQTAQARVSLQEYQLTHPEEVALILKEFGLKPSQLGAYLRASFQAKNKGVSVMHTVHPPPAGNSLDSTMIGEAPGIVALTGESTFDINDKYLSLHGSIKPGDFFQEVKWEYIYSDTLYFVGHTNRKNFFNPLFKKEKFFVDAKVNNPKAQITSLRNVQITEFKDKRFAVGPGVMFDPFSGKVVVGIGINYAIFKF